MKESSKTKKLDKNFPIEYLKGHGIDIGCGSDVVCENAEPFDIEHGDANDILKYKQRESYDFVYSSHTLEHMFNPVECLNDWFALVKKGGYMIITVPDSELYEQCVFPSPFNPDHKWQFTLNRNLEGIKLILIDNLLNGLDGCKIISKQLQDFNYDYSLKSSGGTKFAITMGKFLSKRLFVLKQHNISLNQKFLKLLAKFLRNTFGILIDQTAFFNATAQIRFIVQKNPT